MVRKLIAGLGNPGEEYAKTRHNVGFMLIDKIRDKFTHDSYKNKFSSKFIEINLQGISVILLKPQTYMNLSGNAILECKNFFKIPVSDIIIVHDDIDLKIGKVKVKKGGGDGGHNGLKSIDALIGKDYQRIRIGVSRPFDKISVSDYVLSNFYPEEIPIIKSSIEVVTNNISTLVSDNSEKFMNHYSIEFNKIKIEEKHGI